MDNFDKDKEAELVILKAEITEEIQEIDRLLADFQVNYDKHLNELDDSFILGGMGYILHSFYNGVENIFFKISKYYENNLPKDSWHSELLKRMKLEIPGFRDRVISDELFEELDEYRGFRHVFRNTYNFRLKKKKEKPLLEALPATWNRLKGEIHDFFRK